MPEVKFNPSFLEECLGPAGLGWAGSLQGYRSMVSLVIDDTLDNLTHSAWAAQLLSLDLDRRGGLKILLLIPLCACACKQLCFHFIFSKVSKNDFINCYLFS